MIQNHSVIFERHKNKDDPAPASEKERTKETRRLDQLAGGSARNLLQIKTVFPFNFFPDEVVIDEVKVSIHTSYFFYSKEVRSIEYKDIFNLTVQESIFFARLEIFDRYFSQTPFIIDFLWKKDAVLARHLIQGLIIAKKENINTTVLPMDDLIKKLNTIGKSR